VIELTDDFPIGKTGLEFNKVFAPHDMQTEEFAQYVYDYGTQNLHEMPHLYSAYQVYEADTERQQYKFINWLNITNQDAAGLYP
jgi:hypothetical protein